MNEWYFTFGPVHVDSDGNSLGNCYCPVRARTADEAKTIMALTRGRKWSHQYNDEQIKDTIVRHSLNPVTLSSIFLPEDDAPRGFNVLMFHMVEESE